MVDGSRRIEGRIRRRKSSRQVNELLVACVCVSARVCERVFDGDDVDVASGPLSPLPFPFQSLSLSLSLPRQLGVLPCPNVIARRRRQSKT